MRLFPFIRKFVEKEDVGLKGRIYISGTGRAGTTFLVQLLSHLGLDTGLRSEDQSSRYFPTARAGLELNIFDPAGPMIVKSPFLCEQVDDVIASGIQIACVVIPVRDFSAAAASRRFVQNEATGQQDGKAVPGGLWETEVAENQVAVLQRKFCSLVEALTRHDVPMTFISFPRLARDPDYLFDKLSFMLPNIDRKAFRLAFNDIVKPELIHDFSVSTHD